MKEYIDRIESILGITLTEDEIQSYNFENTVLEELIDFANNYAVNNESSGNPETLNCFLSLPDINENSFNTYSLGSGLENHWPNKGVLINSILFNDRVLIHDHLKHYAESSITGYIVGQRYVGIKNWLTALAEWRGLILENIICIIPKNLSYSSSIREIWEDELFDFAKLLLSEFNSYAKAMIKQGYEDEYIDEIHEIAYLLASLSISRNNQDFIIPFFNKNGSLNIYEKTLFTFMDNAISQFSKGKEPGNPTPPINKFTAKISLQAFLDPYSNEATDNLLLFQYHNLFEDIRSDIIEIIKMLSADKLFDNNDHKQEHEFILNKQNDWKLRFGKLNKKQGANPEDINLGFAACHLPRIYSKNKINMYNAYKTIFDTYNNSPYLKNEDQMLNYYFSIL